MRGVKLYIYTEFDHIQQYVHWVPARAIIHVNQSSTGNGGGDGGDQ